MRQILRRDADTMVFEDNPRRASIFTFDSYLNHLAFRAIAHSIFQKVEPHQLQILWIGPKKHFAVGGKMDIGTPRLRQITHSLYSFLAGCSDIDELKVPPQRPMCPLLSACQPQ